MFRYFLQPETPELNRLLVESRWLFKYPSLLPLKREMSLKVSSCNHLTSSAAFAMFEKGSERKIYRFAI